MPFVPDKPSAGRFVPDQAAPERASFLDTYRRQLDLNPGIGAVETGIQGLRNAGGAAIAGLAGIGATFANHPLLKALGVKAPSGTEAFDRTQQAIDSAVPQYQPRTLAGNVASTATNYIPEKIAKAGDVAGGAVAEKTGSPALGAATNVAIQSLPAAILPLLRGRVAAALPETDVPRFTRPGGNSAGSAGAQASEAATPAGRQAGLAAVSEAAPTAEKLSADATAAYKRARDSGAVVSPESFAAEKAKLVSNLAREGIDPTLHPRATAALKRITDTEGPVSLDQIETLRKIARDAESDINPLTHRPTPDARLGGKIVDAIDSYTESLDPRSLVSGSPEAAAAFKEARSLYSRAAKSNDISALIDRAQTKAGAHYTQAGMEHAIRQEFKSLALNPQRLRFFTKEEQAAIKSIARGSPMENIVRAVGKFDPTSGGVASIPSIMAALAAGPAGLAVPVTGFAARRLATRMTAKKVTALDEMVRRGPRNALAGETARRNALAEAP